MKMINKREKVHGKNYVDFHAREIMRDYLQMRGFTFSIYSYIAYQITKEKFSHTQTERRKIRKTWGSIFRRN